MSTRTVSSVRWPGFAFADRFVALVGKDAILLGMAVKTSYSTELAWTSLRPGDKCDGAKERQMHFHAGRAPRRKDTIVSLAGSFPSYFLSFPISIPSLHFL